MTTVVLAVVMTVFGWVLNPGWMLVRDSGTGAEVPTSGSGGAQDAAKPNRPGDKGGADTHTGKDSGPGDNGGTDTITISGRISSDGKVFTSDHEQTWSIANTASVKGYEGQKVTMRARVDADKNRIHVMGLKMAGKKPADSANSEKKK